VDVLIGCPVLGGYLSALDHQVVMSDQQAWDDLKAKADNERPDAKHALRCAILAVAFQLEEIAFALVRVHLKDEANTIRTIPGPMREAKDLDKVLETLEPLFDRIAAEVVQFKLMGEALSTEQIRQKAFDSLRRALSITASSTRFLRTHWETSDDANEYRTCGRELGLVCQELSTTHSRRFAYAKSLLGDH
jgi:hypothetical protein